MYRLADETTMDDRTISKSIPKMEKRMTVQTKAQYFYLIDPI